MKITVSKQRECCESEDLLPIEGSPKFGRFSEFVFCKHCGRHHEYETFMDAAGSRDWRYAPLPRPWANRNATAIGAAGAEGRPHD